MLQIPGFLRELATLLLIATMAIVVSSCRDDSGRVPATPSVAGETATPSRVTSPGSSSSEPLVATYFYYWYDLPDGPHSEPLTDHPVEPAASYLDVDWFEKQFADMSDAGIDVALASYWGKFEPSSNVGLGKMVEAYDAMVAEDESPPKVGMFLDTGAIARLDLQYRDLTQVENQRIFYSLIRGYYSDVPERVWAKVDGRPIIWLWAAYFGIQFDRSLFEYVSSQFEEDFGSLPYIVGEDSWRYAHPSGGGVDYDAGVMPLDDFYIWGAANSGFQKPTGGVAEVGPGYNERTLPGPDRIGRYQDREGGEFYAENFRRAIDSGSPMIAIETWNEFHEATDIADSLEYGRQYIEMTRRFVDQFKGVTTTAQPSKATPTPAPSASLGPPQAPTLTRTAIPTSNVPPGVTVTSAPPSVIRMRGDQDCDNDVDTGDVIALLSYLAKPPHAGISKCEADVDCDAAVVALDVLSILEIVADGSFVSRVSCPR